MIALCLRGTAEGQGGHHGLSAGLSAGRRGNRGTGLLGGRRDAGAGTDQCIVKVVTVVIAVVVVILVVLQLFGLATPVEVPPVTQ